MWSHTCPKTAGLRCDCAVQYLALLGIYIVCGILVILGSCECQFTTYYHSNFTQIPPIISNFRLYFGFWEEL